MADERIRGVDVRGVWASDPRYSHAVRAGGLVFVSGQAGLDADGRLADGFAAQAHATFANLRTVLEAAGTGLDSVVRLGVFLTDIGFLPELREVRAAYFGEPFPADTTVEVGRLAQDGALLEIDAIALAPPPG